MDSINFIQTKSNEMDICKQDKQINNKTPTSYGKQNCTKKIIRDL